MATSLQRFILNLESFGQHDRQLDQSVNTLLLAQEMRNRELGANITI